ncbi:Lrp/AsnC family transcriptional regulator [Streptomyces chartreusis]|uniref:Lrp/AsnC family transcriptional regulator n=1 Tax=Streptomyces chartreusis TaxID=1969 RepID=UPI0034309EAA
MPGPLYDGSTPNVDPAEAVRPSPSTCLRRTKALEEDGLLAGYRADLDRERLSLGPTMFLSLKAEHSGTTSQVVEKPRP